MAVAQSEASARVGVGLSIILVWLGRERIGIKVEVRKEVIRKKVMLGVRKQNKKKSETE